MRLRAVKAGFGERERVQECVVVRTREDRSAINPSSQLLLAESPEELGSQDFCVSRSCALL